MWSLWLQVIKRGDWAQEMIKNASVCCTHCRIGNLRLHHSLHCKRLYTVCQCCVCSLYILYMCVYIYTYVCACTCVCVCMYVAPKWPKNCYYSFRNLQFLRKSVTSVVFRSALKKISCLALCSVRRHRIN